VIDSPYYDQWQAARRLLDYHIQELLPASIEYAKQVGARQIIAFSFDRGDQPPGLPPDEILEIFQMSAKMVAQAGMQLAIEVENNFWADTGERTAAIMRAVAEAGLGVNWDPGNAFVAGDMPFPKGYQAIREYVQHVHFKDVVRRPDGTCDYACEGDIDWAWQIRALVEDGYQGFVSVEPHLQPKVAAARAMTARLKQLVQMNERPA
jgi:sugar phosphate isomerase/epimerase